MTTNERVPRVLIIEDDIDIAAAVRDHLAREGVKSEHFTSMSPVARRLESGGVDAMILDIMLPDGSGLELCRSVREAGWTLPILFLTAKNEEGDQITGLDAGGDDYVTKPFSSATLTARVRALVRRSTVYNAGEAAGAGVLDYSAGYSEREEQRAPLDGRNSRDLPPFTLGSRVIDFAASEIRSPGAEVDMTAKERHLLAVFVSRPNTILTRDQLFRTVWGDTHHGDPGTVAVHVRRLREKLEDDPSQPRFLQTVRGLGYRFRPDARTDIRADVRPDPFRPGSRGDGESS